MKQLELPLSRQSRAKRSQRPSRSKEAAAVARRSQHVPHSTRPEVSGPAHVVWLAYIGVNDVPGPRWQEAVVWSIQPA